MTEQDRQNKNNTIYNIILQLKKVDKKNYVPSYIYADLSENLQSLDHEVLRKIDLCLKAEPTLVDNRPMPDFV